MTAGIGFTALAWVVIGTIQVAMDGGTPTSMAWQILPYAILTLGEVLVSATGLEFAYSQAPASMKGIIMAFWSLAVTVGSLWVLIVNASVKNDAVLGYISQQRDGRDRLPDVLLRRVRVRRRGHLRLVRDALPHDQQLPRLSAANQ